MVSLLKLSSSILSHNAAFKNCRIISFLMIDESVSKRYSNSSTSQTKCDRYDSIEARTVEFTPCRARDISGATLNMHEKNEEPFVDCHSSSCDDDHVDSYDAHGTISLNSVMQTNVPEPFTTRESGVPTHLNMPGGHTSQNQKYLAENLQNAHYSRSCGVSTPNEGMSNVWHAWFAPLRLDQMFYIRYNFSLYKPLLNSSLYCPLVSSISIRHFFKKRESETTTKPVKASQRQLLKKAIKEYGVTILIFHIVISLISLGGFYLAISSGINLLKLLETLGLEHGMISRKFAAGASTFVIAYAIHKVFAPARIAITLAAAPFVVRYLRKMRLMKPPKR